MCKPTSSLRLFIITTISHDINQSRVIAISLSDRSSASKWVKTFHCLNCKWLTDPDVSLIACQNAKQKYNTLCDACWESWRFCWDRKLLLLNGSITALCQTPHESRASMKMMASPFVCSSYISPPSYLFQPNGSPLPKEGLNISTPLATNYVSKSTNKSVYCLFLVNHSSKCTVSFLLVEFHRRTKKKKKWKYTFATMVY
jgi:hypothetical protein